MAIKKKVRLSSAEKARMAVEQDFYTSDQQVAAGDTYQTPVDVQEAATQLDISGLNFKSEVEMQEFLKMSSEEKNAFIAEKEKRRKQVPQGSSELEKRKVMLRGL